MVSLVYRVGEITETEPERKKAVMECCWLSNFMVFEQRVFNGTGARLWIGECILEAL